MSSGTIARRLRRTLDGVGTAGSGRPAPANQQSRPSGRIRPRTWTLIAFAAPSLVLVVGLNLYPLIYAVLQSVRDGDLIGEGPFVGLANYRDIFIDLAFWRAARFTVIFTVVGVFGSWVTGLALALLLKAGLPAGGLLKVLLLLPWVVPVVVTATSWNWLVATPQSPLPILGQALGLGNVLFLADPTFAKITVCVFKVWVSFPFMMMMMSSALASVDNDVYEAAKVDGASRWQTLRHITLQLISLPTYISWILMTIFCVNDFPSIYLLTGGGPSGATSSLVVLAFETVFGNFETGRGVAIAFVMTLVLALVSVALYGQIRKADVA